jgi:hypothetical protein
MVTRSQTGSLPPQAPSFSGLNDFDVSQQLMLVHVGQKVDFTFRLLPEMALRKATGECLRRRDRQLQFVIPDVVTDDLITLPIPENSRYANMRIHSIEPQPFYELPLKPFNCSNREPRKDAKCVIYADGGSHQTNGGPAAASIVVFKIENGTVVRKDFGRFYPGTTNNCAESASMLAALRYAKLHVPSGDDVTIVNDAMLVYDFVLGNSTFKDAKLRGLGLMINGVLDNELVLRTTFCHMFRSYGNYADEVCNRVIATGADVGNMPELFCDVPYVQPNKHRPQHVVQPVLCPDLPQPLTIESIEDFANLRQFSVRSTVPPEAEPYWGSLAHRAAQAVVMATTAEARDKALIELFVLPVRYLPANSRTASVVMHLKHGKPFHINQRKEAVAVRDHVPDEKMHRLREAVHRHAKDGKMRTANKLLRNQATTDDVPFDTKVEMLDAKLVKRDEDDDGSDATFALSEVPAVSGNEVRKALHKINRQSATSVEGWSKDHLAVAMRAMPGLDNLIGQILTTIMSQPLTPLLEQILRCGRLVGIPKDPAGIRPIAIASLWMKLMGCVAMDRDDTRPNMRQYAIRHKDGCSKIIHQVREELTKRTEEDPGGDWIVVKFDLSNAFNSTKRKKIKERLESHCTTMQQYFRLAYGGPSPLVVFGPGSFKILEMEEGIRQGDTTSTLLFCLGVDEPLEKLQSLSRLCWMFCDDLTMIIRRVELEEATAQVKEAFGAVGLSVNEDKLDYYNQQQVRTKPFVLLGADLACTTEFIEKQKAKQQNYFHLLGRVPIHPQLKVCLLRLCGAPRLRYIASTMDPKTIESLTKDFDAKAISTLASTLEVPESDLNNSGLLHDSMGAGIPNYTALSPALYAAAHHQAIHGGEVHVELLTKGDTSGHPTAHHNLDSQWLWYDGTMTPAEFIAAYCIRLGILPPHLRLYPIRCDCGFTVTSDWTQIEHTLMCDRFTSVTHTRRHNMVRDEMCRVAASFGIVSTKEPTCYRYVEGRKRPDILFATFTPHVTDITIVKPVGDPGNAARIADDEKRHIHRDAVQQNQHVFVPAACETYGLMGKGMTQLISVLSKDIPISSQFVFRRAMTNAVAVALARSRAAAVAGTRYRRDNIMPH